MRLAELAAECAVALAKNEALPTDSVRTSKINNGFADIPTVWLEPEYVDKYNLNKVVIDSGFHSAASIYKE